MANFAALKEVETQATIIRDLIKLSSARIPQSAIQQIIGWEYNGGVVPDAVYGEFKIGNIAPTVSIHEDPHAFAKAVTLLDYEMSHSWAGDDTEKNFGFWIVGDGNFGSRINHSFYNNGNYAGGEEKEANPGFSLTEIQVALVNQKISDHYNNNCRDEDNWLLHVYVPGNISLDPELYELAVKFNLMGKLV